MTIRNLAIKAARSESVRYLKYRAFSFKFPANFKAQENARKEKEGGQDACNSASKFLVKFIFPKANCLVEAEWMCC